MFQKQSLLILTALAIFLGVGFLLHQASELFAPLPISGAPPYGTPEGEIPSIKPWEDLRLTWRRPDGPPKIALQVGHWKNQEVPQELIKLKANTGASGGGYTETEVNLKIAKQTAQLLKEKGYTVEILPATVPPDYWADAFIAIHADGNLDPTMSGFKIAAPWRDLTGKADTLALMMTEIYQQHINLPLDPLVSANMRGYYAFSWWRYEHSIHPMTTAVIVETGFLTNPRDRKIITEDSEKVAVALTEGISSFISSLGI